MSGQIWLCRDSDRVPLPRGTSALWVYAKTWPAPRAERVMTAAQYLAAPHDSLTGVNDLIVVGLSDIVTPANRVRTGPYLTDPWRGPRRHSVDARLFRGEPWRAWWHWGCVGAPWDDVPHSFCLEGRWNQWMDRRRPDPCALEELARLGAGIVRAIDPPPAPELDVSIVAESIETHSAYAAEKAAAFEQETTWRGLIQRLNAWAQATNASRFMPKLADVCRSSARLDVRATDLPIDTWLLLRLRGTVALIDGINKEFSWTR